MVSPADDKRDCRGPALFADVVALNVFSHKRRGNRRAPPQTRRYSGLGGPPGVARLVRRCTQSEASRTGELRARSWDGGLCGRHVFTKPAS